MDNNSILQKLTIYQITNDLPERYKPMSVEEQMVRKGGGVWPAIIGAIPGVADIIFSPNYNMYTVKMSKIAASVHIFNSMKEMKQAGTVTWNKMVFSGTEIRFYGISIPDSGGGYGNGYGDEGYGGEGYSDPCPDYCGYYDYP